MMLPEKLRIGRASWMPAKSRSIKPLRIDERRLFINRKGYCDEIMTGLKKSYGNDCPPEKIEEIMFPYFEYRRREFIKKSNNIIGQTEEFLNYIFRYSWARGEAVLDEGLLLRLLHAVIWAYLQRYYRKPWDELPQEKLEEMENRAADLTHELSSKIMWPKQSWR